MTEKFEPEITIPLSEVKTVLRDEKLRQIIQACPIDEPGRIGECVEDAILDRLLELYGGESQSKTPTAPAADAGDDVANPEAMKTWLEAESGDECRSCALPVTVQWYEEVLKEGGEDAQAKTLIDISLKESALTVAERMDRIKGTVAPEVRSRLLEMDAATQVNT